MQNNGPQPLETGQKAILFTYIWSPCSVVVNPFQLRLKLIWGLADWRRAESDPPDKFPWFRTTWTPEVCTPMAFLDI